MQIQITFIRYFLLIVFQFEGYLPEWGGTFKYKMVYASGIAGSDGTYLKKNVNSLLIGGIILYFLYAHVDDVIFCYRMYNN